MRACVRACVRVCVHEQVGAAPVRNKVKKTLLIKRCEKNDKRFEMCKRDFKKLYILRAPGMQRGVFSVLVLWHIDIRCIMLHK